jgi:uncharacterized tellurite resistance protein B-like protein
MNINFVDTDTDDFEPEKYIQILIAIAKADRLNGPPEVAYVKRQADRLRLDFESFWESTDKKLLLARMNVSRFTALVILKDCIALASLDSNFSIAEKQLVYTYAEKLDVPRSDVKRLEAWLSDYETLQDKWNQLVADR